MVITTGTASRVDGALRRVESLVGEPHPINYTDWDDVLALATEVKQLRIRVKELEECHHPLRTFHMSLARRAAPAAD